jgi:hypothetical protein
MDQNKVQNTVGAVIGGITEGTGSRKYFGAWMLGVYERSFALRR